jgi:hypothetical protein
MPDACDSPFIAESGLMKKQNPFIAESGLMKKQNPFIAAVSPCTSLQPQPPISSHTCCLSQSLLQHGVLVKDGRISLKPYCWLVKSLACVQGAQHQQSCHGSCTVTIDTISI